MRCKKVHIYKVAVNCQNYSDHKHMLNLKYSDGVLCCAALSCSKLLNFCSVFNYLKYSY